MNASLKCMLALLLVGASGVASAQETTYFYTGNPFTSAAGSYTTDESVSGSVTFAAPLAQNLGNGINLVTVSPVSFSFSDGVQTITSTNATSDYFDFRTDPTGAIAEWDIELNNSSSASRIETEGKDGGGGRDYGFLDPISDYGISISISDVGVWTEQTVQSPSAAPELDPASTASALTLLAGALLMLRGRRDGQHPLRCARQ